MHIVGVADLNTARARSQLKLACWPEEQYAAGSIGDALKHGATLVTDNADQLIDHPGIEVIIEATGDPGAGIRFALRAISHGKHIVMVNVEADACAGPLLARKAREAGVVYSLAWGDQPALIADHVDWARACGFRVVSAGKGTRYHPTYHQSTPDTVWDILDKYMKIKDRNSINPKMFNSFVDGTKSGIEMTAVCNATGLQSQAEGLSFPPATRFEHAEICKPKADGGVLERAGVTEVTSSVYRDGTDVPHSLVMGTYVVFEIRQRLQRRVLPRIFDAAGQERPLCLPLPSDPHDRARTRHLGRVGCAAQGADGRADLLQFRRRRHGQARPQGGRDARWRGRLLRLGQADAGRRPRWRKAICPSASHIASSSSTISRRASV